MKSNTPKSSAGYKIQENQQNLTGSRERGVLPSKKAKQGMKNMEKVPELTFIKQEKPKRGRPKLTEDQRKERCQSVQPKSKGGKKKQAPSPNSFPGNLLSIDTFRGKQQQRLHPSIPPQQCTKSSHAKVKKSEPAPQDHLASSKEPQLEPKSKKKKKELKKMEKLKIEANSAKEEASEEYSSAKKEEEEQFSEELLSLFRQKYGYYMIGEKKIVFPIEDSLLSLYPELSSAKSPEEYQIHQQQMEILPDTFCKELQIWNLLIENASFFQIKEKVKVTDIQKIFGDPQGEEGMRLWKRFNRFYLNDILYQKYEDSSSEDYYSFISLWRYTDENGFMDKIFHTCWNKFIYFYITITKNIYKDEDVLSQLTYFQDLIRKNLEEGIFQKPECYQQLIEYLILLTNMCFQTSTFKSLINGKMLFFRDNNKMKNQLLEEKKSHENHLWELKDSEKTLAKKEKVLVKASKKEGKANNQSKVAEIQRQLQTIHEERDVIANRKLFFNQKILDIDNKIYELCCLPQFSNVWLLGEDRFRNLYWFVREHEDRIYQENCLTKKWSQITDQNIDYFHKCLNPRGIRQRKLYDKILYYKQLGYIKTSIMKEQKYEMEVEPGHYMIHEEERDQEMIAEERKENEIHEQDEAMNKSYDSSQFQKFVYGQYKIASPQIIRLMILKSEWLMTKYLFQRNSRWIAEDLRQEYINKMTTCDLADLSNYENITNELKIFNQKICVVEINIKVANQNDVIEVKTRKIQTKIWGINQKYKHFWYDYSKRCKTLSDIHFLVSTLYLTIERYVNKTRKPNNTKYFYKTVDFGENQEVCEACEAGGELATCSNCDLFFHQECLMKHSEDCPQKISKPEQFIDLESEK